MHPSGIEILDSPDPEETPIPEAAAATLSMAMQLSADDASNFAYPFYDANTKTVVISPATQAGRQRAAGARQAAARAGAALEATAVEQRDAAVSRKQIDAAMDDLIGRQREGIAVMDAYPDPAHNRVILEVSALDDTFLYRAARTHGATTVAVRLSPDADVVRSPAVGREADNTPFYGGANVNGCTSGFAWHSGSTEMMLTAGHCFPGGGSASTPTSTMGTVASGSEESWASGTGTVLMTGRATYRGDLALIRIYSGKASASFIYRGGAGSSSAASVAGKWSRSPAKNDKYCTGGRVSGELCNWNVEWSAAGNFYYNGTGETARRVWRGEKRGYCMEGGDSGGPVYTVNTNGSVAAKGIVSGVGGYGGSDHFAGALDPACVNVFTDIWDAYYGMPGDIN